MQKVLQPVGIGLLLGFFSLLFGISWAMYITVNNDRIQQALEASARAALEDKFVIMAGPAHSHGMQGMNDMGHMKDTDGGQGTEATTEHGKAGTEGLIKGAGEGNDPLLNEARERLTKGHLHAMGLGTLTLIVSLLTALVDAPPKVKTLASACIGVGGLFYPVSWIIMGYRTPALGAEGASQSVLPITALSVLLVFLGIIIPLFYFLRGILSGR